MNLKFNLVGAIFLALFLGGVFAHNLHAMQIIGTSGSKIFGEVIATFEKPWALSLINNDTMLITTKDGTLWLVDAFGFKKPVGNVPEVSVGGQGGLGDVIIHPEFDKNRLIYISYVSTDNFGLTKFAKVIRAKLTISDTPKLTDITDIWQQIPATTGSGHFSHKMVFGPAGSDYERDIFISSGDRQKMNPAQRWDTNLGKIIRLTEDGKAPKDNPFQNKGLLAKSFWTLGHRNVLGIAFRKGGQLWSTEMGPKDGDELNLIQKGANYGWPIVSEGSHYSGIKIPSHKTYTEFQAPALFWIPTIAPSGLAFYEGAEFPTWNGNALIGGLKSRALIRIAFNKDKPEEVERFSWSKRVRDIEIGKDGVIWVIEDGDNASLIKFLKSP